MTALKKVYKSSIDCNGDFIFDLVKKYIDEGKKIAYIMPSTFALESKRNEYLDKLSVISDLKFFTFDSFRNMNLNKKSMDKNMLKRFLYENLQSNNYKYIKNSSGMVDELLNFIRKAREDQIKLEASEDPFFDELLLIYKDYLNFLDKHNLTDLLENFPIKEDLDLVIIDGFFSIKNLDFDLIKNDFKEIDTLVNIPYYINDYFFNDKLIKKLKELGFEEENLYRENNKEELLDKLSNKIKILEIDNQYLRDRQLIKLIKKNVYDIDLVNFSSSSLDFKEYLGLEDIRINGQADNALSVKILKELIVLLKYMANGSRTNLLKRLDLVYFPILGDNNYLVEEFKNFDFKNYQDLYEKTRKSVELRYISPDLFYESMKKLDEKFENKSTFKNYSEIIEDLMTSASERVVEIYEENQDKELFLVNNKVIGKIKSILDIFKKYDKYFGQIDIESYIEMLEDSLDNVEIYEKNYYDPSIYQIDQSLCVRFKKLILEGLDLNYPNYKRNDPIFNPKNKQVLEKLSFEYLDEEDVYQSSLLRLIKLLVNSELAYILTIKDSNDFSVLLSIFQDIEKVNLDQISSVNELGFSIISDLKSKKLDKGKFAQYYKYSDFKNINEKIYSEEKRKIDNSIKLDSDSLVIIKDLVANRDFHATDFDAYIRSSYGFLYSRLVGIEELEEKAQEYIDMGNLFHRVLEDYFKINKDSMDQEYLKKLIVRNIRDIFDRDIETGLVLDRIFFENTYDNLEKFIKMDLETRKDNQPESFEMPFELEIEGIKIKGRIDRIDDSQGLKIITDYKSSTAPSTKSVEEFKSFQMPIYMMAIENTKELRYGIIRAASYRTALLLKDENTKSKRALSPEEMEEFIDLVKIKIKELIDRILSGNFTSLDGSYDENTFKNMLREARF